VAEPEPSTTNVNAQKANTTDYASGLLEFLKGRRKRRPPTVQKELVGICIAIVELDELSDNPDDSEIARCLISSLERQIKSGKKPRVSIVSHSRMRRKVKLATRLLNDLYLHAKNETPPNRTATLRHFREEFERLFREIYDRMVHNELQAGASTNPN
jgi:hypothetical protein